MFASACEANFAVQACAIWNVALYLVPSALMALLFRLAARLHPAFFLFYLTGTILHELAHYCAGLITNARPVSFSLMPRRAGPGRWILGSVSFANIRWYNAGIVGLAPLFILAVPVIAALLRLASGEAYGWQDALLAFLLAPVYLSFLPSKPDCLIAFRSWPYAVMGLIWVWWIWR